jgi:hypothetical protein
VHQKTKVVAYACHSCNLTDAENLSFMGNETIASALSAFLWSLCLITVFETSKKRQLSGISE